MNRELWDLLRQWEPTKKEDELFLQLEEMYREERHYMHAADTTKVLRGEASRWIHARWRKRRDRETDDDRVAYIITLRCVKNVRRWLRET